MSAQKIDHSFTIYDDHLAWLREMVARYDLPDEGKALRILLDHARHDGDLDSIFEEIRCHHCG